MREYYSSYRKKMEYYSPIVQKSTKKVILFPVSLRMGILFPAGEKEAIYSTKAILLKSYRYNFDQIKFFLQGARKYGKFKFSSSGQQNPFKIGGHIRL